jgi:Sugar-tranasporters, 12 TM
VSNAEPLQKALREIVSDRRLRSIGLYQGLFEGCMMTWFCLWTPALDNKKNALGEGTKCCNVVCYYAYTVSMSSCTNIAFIALLRHTSASTTQYRSVTTHETRALYDVEISKHAVAVCIDFLFEQD